MGYTTTFIGSLRTSKNLSAQQLEKLHRIQITRHNYTEFPSIWNNWEVVAKDSNHFLFDEQHHLQWNGGEKFYNYVEWLKYLIDNYFEPWGITLSGMITYIGEDKSDYGVIECEEKSNFDKGIVETQVGVYELSDPEFVKRLIKEVKQINK